MARVAFAEGVSGLYTINQTTGAASLIGALNAGNEILGGLLSLPTVHFLRN
jgi:hypothetical protein